MDASDLRLFAAVARTGGIGKAALELNTVQSNVTARLKALEDRLGTALFERSNRGVALTAVLAGFAKSFPTVDLSLKTGTSAELVTQVLDRTLDGAFLCGPIDHADLQAEAMFAEELVVLTAPGIPDLGDLLRSADLKIIVLRVGCSYRLIFESYLARRGIVGVRVVEFGRRGPRCHAAAEVPDRCCLER